MPIVKKYLCRISCYDLDGPLEEAIAELLKEKAKYPGWDKYRLDFDDNGLHLYGEREETQADIEARQKSEQAKAEIQLANNAAQAKRLLADVRRVNTPQGVAAWEELRKIVGA